ncbi:MAG: MuF-C-terminal domain-containing protein [Schwartzia sp. (in: firmicutes)]
MPLDKAAWRDYGAELERQKAEEAAKEEPVAPKGITDRQAAQGIDLAEEITSEEKDYTDEEIKKEASALRYLGEKTAENVGEKLFNNRTAEVYHALLEDAWQTQRDFAEAGIENQGTAVTAEEVEKAKARVMEEPLLSAATREAGQEFIAAYADNPKSAMQSAAQGLRRTDTSINFWMTDEERLSKAKEIEAATGISASAILDDTEAYRSAMNIYDHQKKVLALWQKEGAPDNLTDVMTEVYKEFPGLEQLSYEDPAAAALALHDIHHVREARDTITAWKEAWRYGWLEQEYGILKDKEADGKASENDKARMAVLEEELKTEPVTPSFFEAPWLTAVSGLAGSMPMMADALTEGAIWGVAGAAVGAAVSAPAGGAGAIPGFFTGGVRGMARAIGRHAVGRGMANGFTWGRRFGELNSMYKAQRGQDFAEYQKMTDEFGERLLSDEAAAKYSQVSGAAKAAVEVAPMELFLSKFKASPQAQKVFRRIIEQGDMDRAFRRDVFHAMAGRGKDILEVTMAEAGEEGAQQAIGDLAHNQIELDTGDTNAKNGGVFTPEEIMTRAGMATVAALPTSFLFGVIPAVGGVGLDAGHFSKLGKEMEKLREAYSAEERQTMAGTVVVAELQRVAQDSRLKETSPDTQRKLLREELAGSGLEIAYIDTSLAMGQKNGMDDIKKVGRAAGLSDEAIADTVEAGGILAVPVECYAQSEASQELLDAVSFSAEAEPMGRMKARAKAFYEEAKDRLKKTAERQKRLEETITKEFFPSEGEERDMAMEAMALNPENPAQGWREMQEEVEKERTDILAEAQSAIEKGLPKEEGQAGAAWYEAWEKEHGRAPSEEDLKAIAYALTVGAEDAPNVEGFNRGAEVAAIRAAAKERLSELDQKQKVLSSIKERMMTLTGKEMRETEMLTREGFRVYRSILSDLKSAENPKVTRAARIGALLFARHADIYASIMRKRGGEYANYTAMDYYNEAFALDVSGKAKGAGETYEQAAMYRHPAKTFSDFMGKVLSGEAGKSYYDMPLDNTLLRIYSDDVKHIQTGAHQHPLSVEEWDVLLRHLNHIDEAWRTKDTKKPRGMAVVVKFQRAGKSYGAVLEFSKTGTVFLKTAVAGSEKKVDGVLKINKREAGMRLHPGLPGRTAETGDSHAAFASHSLSLSSIQNILGIRKRYNQEAANAQTAAERLQADAKAWKETLAGAWAGKLAKTQMFRVMETPLVLQLVGAKTLPIYMSQGKLMKIKKEHPEIKKALLNKLPEQLADPMMIFQSETVPGRIVVCLELKDEAGVNIVVPIELNAKNDRMEINVLTSIYGRGTEDHTEVQYTWFLNNVRQGRALYVNKKQAANFYRAAGLQLPMEGRKFNDLFGSSIKTDADLVKEKMKNPALYQETHGETRMLQNGRRIVSLFERADESTFLHELGHVFLDDLRSLAAFDEVSQRELSTVEAWAAWHEGAAKEYENTPWAAEFKAHEAAILKAKKSGDAKALEKALAVWQHERFARAFERYLKEGEAPARGLKQVFRKFAAFLRSIYQAFTSDGGRASLEVERVMDRMIATDEEIETAAQEKRYRDLTKAGGKKLFSESDKATYQRWHEKAKAEAKERLRKAVTKKLERARKAKLSAEIESEEERFRAKLYEDPIYRAREAVEMAKDEKAALLFYPTIEAYREEDKRAPEMEAIVEEHMEEYQRTAEKVLLEDAITPEEVEKAMAGTEYHALRLSFEAAAFRRQADALRRLSGKAQAAMDEVEARIEEMPEEPGAEEKGEALTKEEVTARIKEAVQEMDENAIPKIAIEDAHRFDSLGEQALFDIALQEMKKLTDGKITDPLGNEVYFAPGDTETLESYVLHLIAGQGKPMEEIRAKRVLGLSLAKETISNPLAIIVQENGRLAYLSLYTGGKDFHNSIIVGVEEGQAGRVVTVMLTPDKKGDKKAAVREFKKRISGSKEVLYWKGQSGHSRPSSETWASTLNAKLHPSGKFIITDEGEKRKGAKERGESKAKEEEASTKQGAKEEESSAKEPEGWRDLMRAIHRLRAAHRWGAEELSAIDALAKAANKIDLKDAWAKVKEFLTTAHLAEQELKEALRGQNQLYRELARREIAKMTISEASAIMTFRRQERESAARVEKLVKAEQWEEAEKEKQTQIMAAAMVAGSRKVRDRVDILKRKIEGYIKGKDKLPPSEGYWLHHLAYLLRLTDKDAAAPAELEKLGQIRERLSAGLDTKTGEGGADPLAALEKIAAGASENGYFGMTLQEFEEAAQGMAILYVTGRDKDKMKTMAGHTIEEIVDEILGDTTNLLGETSVTQYKVNDDEGGLGYHGILAKAPKIGHIMATAGQRYLAATMKPEMMMEILGEKAHRYLHGTLERAAERESAMTADAMVKVDDIVGAYTNAERRRWQERNIPWFEGEMISKENILAMALNLGNEINRSRLAEGLSDMEHIHPIEEIIARVEQHMEEKDWQFVQNIWDFLGTYWPETVRIEMVMNGTVLHAQPALPFTVQTKTGKEIKMKGGYYPIVYNAMKNTKAMEQTIDEAAKRSMVGAAGLSTGLSSTKSRTQAEIKRRPLLLSLRVIPKHLGEVIHNQSHRIACRDVYRIINSSAFSDHVKKRMGEAFYENLRQWAVDVWQTQSAQFNQAEGNINKLLQGLRSNAALAIMGYRMWPVIENATNLFPAMHQIGAANMLSAVGDYYANIGTYRELLHKSLFMASRMDRMDRDMKRQRQMFEKEGAVPEWLKDHAYLCMEKTDLIFSAPLWCRAYKNAFTPKLAEVTAENEAAKKAIDEAYAEKQKADALVYDLMARQKKIEEELTRRRHSAPLAEETEFSRMTKEELTAEAFGLNGDIMEAERTAAEKERRLELVSEREIKTPKELNKEAEMRSVLAADKAVREVFGSGDVKDLASIQKGSELNKLFTMFYGYFSVQANAIVKAYYRGRSAKSWAPLASAILYRIILTSALATLMRMMLFGEGNDDKDKYQKDKEGKKIEIPLAERILKQYAKNTLSTATGMAVGVRDIGSFYINMAFEGTDYGRGLALFGTASARGMQEATTLSKLLMAREEVNEKARIEEEKRKARYDKMTARQKKKFDEEQKYRRPPRKITWLDISRSAAMTGTYLTANKFGVTDMMTNAVFSTMQYLWDDDGRYEATLWNMLVMSGLFAKKPVKRVIPERPKKEEKRRRRRRR